MKNVVPVRKALGVRTVFNILGPLLNPAACPYLLIGVYNEALVPLMGEALHSLGVIDAATSQETRMDTSPVWARAAACHPRRISCQLRGNVVSVLAGVMIASSPAGKLGSSPRAAPATTAASARLAREVPTCCSLLSTLRKTNGVMPCAVV